MSTGTLVLTIVWFAAVAAIHEAHTTHRQAPVPAKSSGSPRSVWDGVFTEAQRKRGEPIYVRECSTCHGETLKGGEGSPPLTGPEFSEKWNGRTVADLFDNIRLKMPPPPDRPGKLSPQEHADVIAYILRANSFPPSPDRQLSADVEQLKQILITTARPRAPKR